MLLRRDQDDSGVDEGYKVIGAKINLTVRSIGDITACLQSHGLGHGGGDELKRE